MTRLLVLAAVAASRAMQPVVITRAPASTATTEDLRPLLDASIAAAHQAADICREDTGR